MKFRSQPEALVARLRVGLLLVGLVLSAAPTLGADPCVPSDVQLCLREGRFEVRLDWRDFEGNQGQGNAAAITEDTGFFWFFRSTNVEIVVKVLDGRVINGHFWVFLSALTNVEYTLTVTDNVTGNSKSYFNPLGRPWVVADTSALPEVPAGPIVFHCRRDDECPEILVDGDPHATLGRLPAPFRGYGDPSLERDPVTGDLWLSYTWLDVLVVGSGASAKVDLGVRTHLAVSRDGGRSFQYERAVNRTTREAHPDSGVDGWALHEVSTLVREPGGRWQIVWLEFFEPAGPAERSGFLLSRSRAASPPLLGDSTERWARGWATSPSFGAALDLSEIPELADCAVLTEPALFASGGGTVLAANCIVVEGGQRRPERERLVLLREVGASLSFVGVLLDAKDAGHLGADTLEQADLSLSRDGGILLLVTPVRIGEDPQHQGCVAFEVSELDSARVLRDSDGVAVPRAILTAEGNGLGPGLCTYDRTSDSGVLLVIPTVDLESDPVDIEFSLRATGVHP